MSANYRNSGLAMQSRMTDKPTVESMAKNAYTEHCSIQVRISETRQTLNKSSREGTPAMMRKDDRTTQIGPDTRAI